MSLEMVGCKHILSESMFKAFLVVILSFQGILSARTERLRINVTRQSSGDILLLDNDKIDCASLNATCRNNGGRTKQNECNGCKCVSRDTTYVSIENRCINADEITISNCRIYRQSRTPALNQSYRASVSRIIRARHCEIRQKNPQFFSVSGNKGSWTWMKNVDFVLESYERKGTKRVRNWLVKFQARSLSTMLARYPGRIANVKLSCKMRRNEKFTNLCIIFKVAGSVIRNSTIVRNTPAPRRLVTTNGTVLLYTGNDETTKSPHTTVSDSTSTVQKDQNRESGSGKNSQMIWIIISVLVVVIIILAAIIFFICVKKRKEKESNAVYRRRDAAVPHGYDVPAKSHDVDDHVYATIPETRIGNPSANSIPNEYQELNAIDREVNASHYQALVHPEVDYIAVLPDPE